MKIPMLDPSSRINGVGAPRGVPEPLNREISWKENSKAGAFYFHVHQTVSIYSYAPRILLLVSSISVSITNLHEDEGCNDSKGEKHPRPNARGCNTSRKEGFLRHQERKVNENNSWIVSPIMLPSTQLIDVR
uniref:uncharacterized protein LOC117607374 n=1 Tax=Osmia lignaria TaxID=473952 RepID=UPI001478FDD5|nr:uncharacterized protein LOC117607374 [Osmia lignaria]